jgi:hypothetical protein
VGEEDVAATEVASRSSRMVRTNTLRHLLMIAPVIAPIAGICGCVDVLTNPKSARGIAVGAEEIAEPLDAVAGDVTSMTKR